MYSTLPKDLMKILFFATLVSILFAFTGWQAGALYFNLHAERRTPPTPLYIFPVPKSRPAHPSPPSSSDEKIAVQTSVKPQEYVHATIPDTTLKKEPPVLKKRKSSSISKKRASIADNKAFTPPVSSPQADKTSDTRTIVMAYPEKEPESPMHPDLYSIQTGIFRFKTNAEENFHYFSKRGYNPMMVILDYKQKLKIYSVRLGEYEDKNTANVAFRNFKLKEKKDAYLTTLHCKKYLVAVGKKFSNVLNYPNETNPQ